MAKSTQCCKSLSYFLMRLTVWPWTSLQAKIIIRRTSCSKDRLEFLKTERYFLQWYGYPLWQQNIQPTWTSFETFIKQSTCALPCPRHICNSEVGLRQSHSNKTASKRKKNKMNCRDDQKMIWKRPPEAGRDNVINIAISRGLRRCCLGWDTELCEE